MSSNSTNSIKFCIATDVHLGHKQNHFERKNDSFNAFEEVLEISTQEQADFLLLGGDLFDEVNPSQRTIYKCLDILQHYVQGEGKKDLRAEWMENPEYKINFENRNLNIKLPIFTIHGNHDYPSSDFGKISICDLLHVSNYANYFGKHTSLSEIIVKPMIIEKKGIKMKVAIYGLGYIKDHVLNDLFEQKKVKFYELENKEEYFSIFIFHQNRYKKGLKPGAPALKCISSKHIPLWMDLTIWGHEHEAITKIEVEDDRKIFQPGSTVITSFIEAESYPKQCLLIEIKENSSIDLHPVPLRNSYRPMICRHYELSELERQHRQKEELEEVFDVYNFLDNEFKKMLEDVEKEFPGKKPIIRMKIEYSGYEISRCKTLEAKYLEKVANPESIINFWKRREEKHVEENEIFKAFMNKTDVDFEQKEVSHEILINYTKSQENKEVYLDPRELYKIHKNSIDKDLNSKDIETYIHKEIEKKMRPIDKEIDAIFETISKEVDSEAIKRIPDLQNFFSEIGLDDEEDEQKVKEEIIVEEEKPAKKELSKLWEQQMNLLLVREDEIKRNTFCQNYGNNFFFAEEKDKSNQKKEKSNQKKERESGRSTDSINESWFRNGGDFNRMSEGPIKKMSTENEIEIEEEYVQTKPKERLGILKKPNNVSHVKHELDIPHDHDEEDDCCKRAERTAYDEDKTKFNFEGANKMVKNNNDKKIKKKGKEKPEPKDIKKKSVKWDDSDDY